MPIEMWVDRGAARRPPALRDGGPPRVAAVAPADSAFGLLRIYEAYRELQDSPVQYRIFRTMEEARRWLELPETPA